MFFLTNPDLADILGDTDFDFCEFAFFVFWDTRFPGLVVPASRLGGCQFAAAPAVLSQRDLRN